MLAPLIHDVKYFDRPQHRRILLPEITEVQRFCDSSYSTVVIVIAYA
jgi:hypothetical protein